MPDISSEYSAYNDAYRYALKLLSYRNRAVRELEKRLSQKGFDEKTIKSVVDDLIESGLLNDRSFAQNMARRANESKMLGRAGARGYLRAFGLKRDDVDDALSDYDEFTAAENLVQRKLKTMKGIDDMARYRKLNGYLSRRGFSADTIRRVVPGAAAKG